MLGLHDSTFTGSLSNLLEIGWVWESVQVQLAYILCSEDVRESVQVLLEYHDPKDVSSMNVHYSAPTTHEPQVGYVHWGACGVLLYFYEADFIEVLQVISSCPCPQQNIIEVLEGN